MNFLFVDRIYDLDPGTYTLAIKHVSPSDIYLIPDQQGRPTLRSCIIGEAIGQLCSWNVIKASDFKLRLIGGVVGEVNIYDDAYVGDSIRLENTVDVLDLDNGVIYFHGRASVGDKTILTLKNGLGPILPLEDFSDVAVVKKEYSELYRPGPFPDEEANLEGSVIYPPITYQPQHIGFDKVLSWETGKQIIAQKKLSLLAPYFADHFPLKPVLPVSLLLESNLQLGYHFIEDIIGEQHKGTIRTTTVRKIKMGEFVRPGDILTTKLNLKKRENEQFTLAYRSEVNQKRICIAEADFLVDTSKKS